VLALAPDGDFITALGGMAAASWPRLRKFVTASRALAEISRKSQTACKLIGSLAATCPRFRETGARITQATEDK